MQTDYIAIFQLKFDLHSKNTYAKILYTVQTSDVMRFFMLLFP